MFLSLISLVGFSQPTLVNDIKVLLKEEPKLLVRFEARNAFISNFPVKTWGIKGGIHYNRVLNFGIGIHWTEPLHFEYENRTNRFTLGYASIFGEYQFYDKEKWKATIPVQVGVGVYNIRRNDLGRINEKKSLVILYEPAITLEYQLFKFMGLGTGIGYRLAVKNKSHSEVRLTAPVYLLKIKIYFHKIVKEIKG